MKRKRDILKEIIDARPKQNYACDEDGQPLIRTLNAARIDDRTIDEMVGMCRGVIADGMVNQKEAEFLQQWMEANLEFTDDLLARRLYGRIKEMLSDKILDREERGELFDLLSSFSGNAPPGEIAKNITSSLPLDNPQPNIKFPGKSFCFTGKFVYGPRHICQELVIDRGGIIKISVSNSLDYLVLGYFGSRDWIHTSYGRKIEKAVQIREEKGLISIISEDHWAEHTFNRTSK